MQGLLDTTVGGLLEQNAARFPDRLAVKCNDRDYRRTWREFDDECTRVAKGLLAAGIRKGDHVAIWATNVPEWLVALFAAAKIGAPLATVNTNYKIYELEYLLRQSDSKALILIHGLKDSNYVEILNELCPELESSRPSELTCKALPRLKTVIYVGEDTPAGMLSFAELASMADQAPAGLYEQTHASLQADETVSLLYTSGTTGFPKGVMLTHRNIVNNGLGIGDCMRLTERDKLCIPVPFFHCFGLVLAVMACMTHAAAMVPVEVFSPIKVLRAAAEEECTGLHGVPTMFIAVLSHPEFKNFRFPKLRTGIMAGSPCPIATMKQVIDVLGMKDVCITYGLTEASPACTMTTPDDPIERRVGSVGRVMPFTQAKITDPQTGGEVPLGLSGEFRTKGYHLMQGYYNMPEASTQAIDAQGWLHSGDLAMADADGYYTITGRIKDLIIRGGENISPKELEDFLYTVPGVRDVQAVGVPSKHYGEEVAVCVIRTEGATVTQDEIKEQVRAHMSRHKVPSYVCFMDEFPMTASGKIQKYKLREMLTEQFRLGDAASSASV